MLTCCRAQKEELERRMQEIADRRMLLQAELMREDAAPQVQLLVLCVN